MTRPSLPSRLRAAGRHRRTAWALAPVLLLFPCAAHADALDQYSVQVLAQSGVPTNGFNPTGNDFVFGSLNNQGQIALITKTQESKGQRMLGLLSGRKFTPIAAGGGPSPDGKTWPTNMDFAAWFNVNEAGNVAFEPLDSGGHPLGVYFWDAAKQTVLPAAVPGMPATGDLVFAAGGTDGVVALNNRDEVAFVMPMKAASGPVRDGIFLRRADGHLDPVAIAGDPLPGQGGTLRTAGGFVGVNDAGQVTFDASGTGIRPVANGFWTDSVYRWENGTISLLAESGTEISGLGTSEGFFNFGPNNQSGNVLMSIWTPSSPGIGGVLLWRQGQLVPVLVLGQELPGGGQFKGGYIESALPNDQGQYVFEVQFKENGASGVGAYRVDEDGKLSLIARSGMTTPLGPLTRIYLDGSGGLAINQQGQVALTAQIDNGPHVLLLLTPKGSAGGAAP